MPSSPPCTPGRRTRRPSSRSWSGSRASARIPIASPTSERSADATAALLEASGLETRPARRGRRFAAGGHRRVDPPRRRADDPALRAPRRAAAGHRRQLVVRSLRARRARRPALRPRDRRRQGRCRRARGDGQGVARHRRRAPVQREGADRGRGGDRLAPPRGVPAGPPRRPRRRRAAPRRRRQLVGRHTRAHLFAARARRRRRCACARSTDPCTRGWPAARSPTPRPRWPACSPHSSTSTATSPSTTSGLDVRSPTDRELARIAALPTDVDGLRQAPGASARASSSQAIRRRRVYERLWHRPGAHGHRSRHPPDRGLVEPDRGDGRGPHQHPAGRGPGSRPGQRGARARTSSGGCRSASSSSSSPTSRSPRGSASPEGWAFDATERALRAGFGVEPVYMGVGGTIPFVGPFAAAFGGIPALLLGPADPRSRIHGEDESLHLDDCASSSRARRSCSPSSPPPGRDGPG